MLTGIQLPNSGKQHDSPMEMDARHRGQPYQLFRKGLPSGVLHLPDLLGSCSLDCQMLRTSFLLASF